MGINQYIKYKSIYFWLILFIFTAIFCLISLVNHYNFRTFALDLGIYNNSIYDYAHFRWNKCTIVSPGFNNFLSDHFNLILLVFSPLYWIFGSYTLLIVQIIGLLWGAYGMYLLVLKDFKKEWAGLLAMLQFLCMWGVFSALAFDYHDNVMASMFLPWFFLSIRNNKLIHAAIWFSLILISKENMALWMVFICLGMIMLYHRNKKIKIKQLSVFSGLALIYFLVIMLIVMPALADPGKPYQHFNYHVFGNSFAEAIPYVLSHPIQAFKLLFINHLNNPLYDGIKAELWLAVFLSGGIALILRPAFLVMLIPIFAQKLFSEHFEHWGINNQYSIEFVPVITYAVYWFLHCLEKEKLQKLIAVIILLTTIGVSASFLDHRVSKFYRHDNHRFYQINHYKRQFHASEVHNFLRSIPADTKVSAQTTLVPHLAFRETIYTYPDINDAEMIILLRTDDVTYPLSRDEYDIKIKELSESGKWKKVDAPESMLVFTTNMK